MKAFNLNDIIKVKLTDRGKDIYYHQHDELNKFYGKEVLKPRYPKVDSNGFTSFQLWHFMEIYGPHMHIGMNNVIEHNDIYIEKKDLNDLVIKPNKKTMKLGELLGNSEVEEIDDEQNNEN